MKDRELETMLEALIHKIDMQNAILCHIHKKKLPKKLIKQAMPNYLYYELESKESEEDEF